MVTQAYSISLPSTVVGDHYLRLGIYDNDTESSYTNSQEEGILLYAGGMYTLKVDGRTYEEIGAGYTRTVENGPTTYQNIKENASSGGNYSLSVDSGGITIKGKNNVTFISNRDDSATDDLDKETTVQLTASGGHDITFKQGDYLKDTQNDLWEELNAHRHKTNVSFVLKQQLGVYNSAFVGIKLTHKKFALKTYLYSVGASTISIGVGGYSSKFIGIATIGFTFFYLKKVYTDLEFCVIKNEYKLHKFENKGIGKSFWAGLKVSVTTYKDRKNAFGVKCKKLEVNL